jgi:hypothetical protein
MGQEFDSGHEFVNGRAQARRNHRPGLLQQASGAFIDAKIRDPGLKSLAESGFPHNGMVLLEMPFMLAENGSLILNETAGDRAPASPIFWRPFAALHAV